VLLSVWPSSGARRLATPFVLPWLALLVLLRVDSSPVCLLISSRKIGTPRKKGGKSGDSSANSSSSAEEGADETLPLSAWSSCLK